MALFSRRPKKPADSQPTEAPRDDVASAPEAGPDASASRDESGAAPDASAVGSAGLPDDTDASVDLETSANVRAPQGSGSPENLTTSEGTSEQGGGGSPEEQAPSVSITMSSFGGLGAAPASTSGTSGGASGTTGTTTGPGATSPGASTTAGSQASAAVPQRRRGARAADEVAPSATETVPGLRDNVLLRDALARMNDGPASQTLLEVARQLMQGHVFLRVKGDARALLAEGKELPLAVATAGERTFALVYSSGTALQQSLRADGDTDTSAMAQPVMAVLRHVLASSYDGIILDPASAPARAVLPRELLAKLLEQADPDLALKSLLAGERTPETAAAVAQALAKVRLWVAVGQAESGAPGLAEGRLADGSRYLEVYSHPLEVAVMGRGDNAAPLTGAQLAKALRADAGLSGVVVDPAGPWIRLTRADLEPALPA